MTDQDRPLIPSSPYFHAGTALLAAAPAMGISMPRDMQRKADVAQKIVDRASMDGLRLQRGIAELEEAASPGLEDLAARLSRRAEAGTRMRDRALHQLATEGKILKGMGVGAGVLGAGLTAKGLYDHFHKEAAVPRAKKEYRRALQMLLEGQHAFHGTVRSNVPAIVERGTLKPGIANAYSRGVPEVYFGNKMPAKGYVAAPHIGSSIAVPRETVLASSPGARMARGGDWTPGPGQADTWLMSPGEVPLTGATVIGDQPVPVDRRKALRLRTIGAEPFFTALEDAYPGAAGAAEKAAPGGSLLTPGTSPAWDAGHARRQAAYDTAIATTEKAPTLEARYARILPDFQSAGRTDDLVKEMLHEGVDPVSVSPSLHRAAKTAGVAQAFHDLGFRETSGRLFEKIALGMTLRFRSPEEAQEHSRTRNIAGALGGGLLGAGIGGAALGKRFGVPGAVVGGVGGAMLGAIPGKILADTAHDYRERTMSTYDDTMQRMNAAAGGNIRVASMFEGLRKEGMEDSTKEMLGGAGATLAGGATAALGGYARHQVQRMDALAAEALKLRMREWNLYDLAESKALQGDDFARKVRHEVLRRIEESHAAMAPVLQRRDRFSSRGMRALPYVGGTLAAGGLALGAKGLYDHFNKEGAESAHDYRERTVSTYDDTMQRLNAAAGGNIRVASVPLHKSAGMVQLEHEEPPQELLDMAAREGHPLSASHVTVYGDGEPIGFMGAHDARTLYVRPDFRDLGYEPRAISHFNYDMQRKRASALDEFVQFTDQDVAERQAPDSELQNASGFQLDQEKRERPPGFGPPSALAGADAGTRMMQIGLPASGAV